MKYPYHNFLFLLLVCTISTSYGAISRDTTLKSIMPSLIGPSAGGPASFQYLMTDGITKIKHDSLSEGANRIAQVLDLAIQQPQVANVIPYPVAEMRDLLKIMGNSKLGPQERAVARAFLKGAFAADRSVSEKKFKAMLAHAPQTNLIIRLSIFVNSIDKAFVPKTIEKYLTKDSTLVYATTLMADKLYSEEQYPLALTYCHRAIRMRPNYAFLYALRGRCYSKLDKANDALADFDQALKLFPNYMEIFYEKADVLMDLDRYNEAVAAYKRICAFAPSYNWCNYNLARAYKGLHKLDSAIYYINNHIKENAEDGDGYDVKGDIYAAGNEYQSALTCYNQAIALNPKKKSFYEDRGDAYLAEDQADTAIIDFKKAISLDSTRSYPVLRIGDCYYFSKRYRESIPYYNKATSMSPNDAYSYTALNRVYNNLKNYPEAIRLGLKAIDVDSTYASALGNLGWTYYCAGQYENCITYSYKALRYNKEAAYAMFNIALATLHKGDVAKAKELYIGFIKTCNDNKYKINDGAVDDLKDLIKAHVYETDAQYIISKIFGKQ